MDKLQDSIVTSFWKDIFCCPSCYYPSLIECNNEPNMQLLICDNCKNEYSGISGSYNFGKTTENRIEEYDYYQQKYLIKLKSNGEDFNKEYWSQKWMDKQYPERSLIMKRLGDIKDKVLLCLGNGASVKELHFLTMGAKLICSDLSMSGILSAKSRYNLGLLTQNIVFHALDACKIPIKDHTIDVVYGYEFVHHLPDLNIFFREIHRVLKPGGFCIFFDNAYSPVWQTAKKTFLLPLMKLSHLIHRRSPEDIRATYTGGFRESYLQELAAKQGLIQGFFDRTMFFQYLYQRGVGSILGWNLPELCYRIPNSLGKFMDNVFTDRIGFLEHSKIGLVWGFYNQ